ncbi:MAG TPA: hypothetical protein VFB06_02500 [Streptosporangiaceae bacterium]|nr:hypothetical protein [Streptosporangiaceae bacterium]
MADRRRQRNVSFSFSLSGLLVALKLAGVIGWPWWEVLLPVWFGLAALFLAASYALTSLLIDRLADYRAARRDLDPRPSHVPR